MHTSTLSYDREESEGGSKGHSRSSSGRELHISYSGLSPLLLPLSPFFHLPPCIIHQHKRRNDRIMMLRNYKKNTINKRGGGERGEERRSVAPLSLDDFDTFLQVDVLHLRVGEALHEV